MDDPRPLNIVGPLLGIGAMCHPFPEFQPLRRRCFLWAIDAAIADHHVVAIDFLDQYHGHCALWAVHSGCDFNHFSNAACASWRVSYRCSDTCPLPLSYRNITAHPVCVWTMWTFISTRGSMVFMFILPYPTCPVFVDRTRWPTP